MHLNNETFYPVSVRFNLTILQDRTEMFCLHVISSSPKPVLIEMKKRFARHL